MSQLYNQVIDPFSRLIELYKLNKAAKIHIPPATPELVELTTEKAVWKVLIPSSPPRFMVLRHGGMSQDFFVVYVDTEKFYRIWLRSSPVFLKRNTTDCVCRTHMPLDYKFAKVAQCFMHDQTNPVPLAWGGVTLTSDGSLKVSFVDGITRTFWLIANHCPSFPIRVRSKEHADLLHQVAGIGASSVSVTLLS